MKRLMRKLLPLLILSSLLPGRALALCESDQPKHFLCKGDKAWETGYLLSPEKMLSLKDRLQTSERSVEELQGLLREMRAQRDGALASVGNLKSTLESATVERNQTVGGLLRQIRSKDRELKSKFDLQQVTVIAGVGVGVGVLVGILIVVGR